MGEEYSMMGDAYSSWGVNRSGWKEVSDGAKRRLEEAKQAFARFVKLYSFDNVDDEQYKFTGQKAISMHLVGKLRPQFTRFVSQFGGKATWVKLSDEEKRAISQYKNRKSAIYFCDLTIDRHVRQKLWQEEPDYFKAEILLSEIALFTCLVHRCGLPEIDAAGWIVPILNKQQQLEKIPKIQNLSAFLDETMQKPEFARVDVPHPRAKVKSRASPPKTTNKSDSDSGQKMAVASKNSVSVISHSSQSQSVSNSNSTVPSAHAHAHDVRAHQQAAQQQQSPWQAILNSGHAFVPQWVQCGACRKWRVTQVAVSQIVHWREPTNWTCAHNQSPANHCSYPQEQPSASQYDTTQLCALSIQRQIKMRRTQLQQQHPQPQSVLANQMHVHRQQRNTSAYQQQSNKQQTVAPKRKRDDLDDEWLPSNKKQKF